ncbi:hypothetical protein [Glycomyces niveus]|uniref:Uncharacterized protein n=1 Tax=Glycomyces niveus TaxID=2820287 RepID=A0ABS3U296_9ACTN|nr:hypothetical protein [Glycomyces sp. NEAU-S30]MBO3732611.1 hypothetical protein [Glycomyces sp. NEAU-S30]
MAERVSIAAVVANGSELRIELEVPERRPLRLKILQPVELAEEFEANDLFSCLLKARISLEEKGIVLCCQGSRPIVFPSGMQRQMGDGRYAYVLADGEFSAASTEVDIFAPADRWEVGSVADQKDMVMRYFGFS